MSTKSETEPGAYGLLAGALVLLLGLLANDGCVPRWSTPPHEHGERDLTAQYAAAVQIEISCLNAAFELGGGYGSGVLVDDHTVLTAAHIAKAETGKVCVWTATLADGTKAMLMPGYVDEKADVASMRTVSPIKHVPPVSFAASPPLGSEICEVAMQPHHVHRCGEVQPPSDPPYDKYITTDMLVDHGNSGSGVYDEDGRLVGITTNLSMCTNDQYCGGLVAVLAPHLNMLLTK